MQHTSALGKHCQIIYQKQNPRIRYQLSNISTNKDFFPPFMWFQAVQIFPRICNIFSFISEDMDNNQLGNWTSFSWDTSWTFHASY